MCPLQTLLTEGHELILTEGHEPILTAATLI